MNKKNIKKIIEITIILIIFMIAGYNLYNKLLKSDTKNNNINNTNEKIKKDNGKKEELVKQKKENENDIESTKNEQNKEELIVIKRDIFEPIIKNQKKADQVNPTPNKENKIYSKLNINGVIKTNKNQNAIVLETGEIINEGDKVKEYTLLKIEGDTAYLVTKDWDVIKISIWEENNEK